jgi:hypothetical protein
MEKHGLVGTARCRGEFDAADVVKPTASTSFFGLARLRPSGLLFPDQDQSQTSSNRLSGVKEISFLIERDDDDANECRITET